jgi:hypothetical protein
MRTAILAVILFTYAFPVRADDKPSTTLCWLAKQARDAAGSEKAAEDAARAKGVSEVLIASAKRCPRT